MKKLNLPLLLTLIIGSFVLVVGTHLLHGYQVSRSVGSLLERADKAREQGDVDQQIKLLRRYVLHRPKDIDQLKVLLKAARERLFELHSEQKDYGDLPRLLFSGLDKAIAEHPEDVELRRQGVQLAMATQRLQDGPLHRPQEVRPLHN